MDPALVAGSIFYVPKDIHCKFSGSPLKTSLHQNHFIQILYLITLWLIGRELSNFVKIPASIIALFFLLLIFLFKKNSLKHFERGGKFLLAEMPLFFIPAVLAFQDHAELFGINGVKILSVIVIGTTIVMVSTAVIVDLLYRKIPA